MDKESVPVALARRWWVVVVFAVLGALVGALPNPGSTADSAAASTQYKAAHTLLVNRSGAADSSFNTVNFKQLELFATVGEVPKRVAARLKFAGAPAQLAAQVTVDLNEDTGAVRIGTVQDSPERAVALADAFAEELTSYLSERQDQLLQQRTAAVQKRLDNLSGTMKTLQAKVVADPNDAVSQAQLDALSRQYSAAFEQSTVLQQQQGQLVLTTLEAAQALPQKSKSSLGLSAPRSRATRGALGALVGALLGLAVAVVLSRVDRRIRTRAQAEHVFGLRASVTIPLTSAENLERIVVGPDRHDSLTDAYRTLRSVVGFVEGGQAHEQGRAPVVVVVSASPGDGKTSVSANLAAAYVETGSRTIAVNTDFRRPALSDRILGDKRQPVAFSLNEVLTLPPKFLLTRTDIERLAVVDLAGAPGGTHGTLARATAHLMPQLALIADAIVVDTSPVGATAEVLEIVPLADVIVVVMRLDHTSIAAATRTIEILRSLTTAHLLLVVVGEGAEKSEYYYYEYSDRGSSKKYSRRGGRHADERVPAVAGAEPS